MPLEPEAFKRALSQFASGVTVVTTRDGAGRPQGLTVSAFCSVSLDPPLVLVCIERRPEAGAAIAASGAFAVSVLAEGQEEVSRRFAWSGNDKFQAGDLVLAPSGLAFVRGALAHLECRLTASHEAGDHVIYVGEVLSVAVEPGRPLLYHDRGYRRLENAGS